MLKYISNCNTSFVTPVYRKIKKKKKKKKKKKRRLTFTFLPRKKRFYLLALRQETSRIKVRLFPFFFPSSSSSCEAAPRTILAPPIVFALRRLRPRNEISAASLHFHGKTTRYEDFARGKSFWWRVITRDRATKSLQETSKWGRSSS